MQATEVTPPASAAAAPVAIVSSSSLPGSRRWTWMSIRPGQTIRPRASMTTSASSKPPPHRQDPAPADPEVADLVEALARVDDPAALIWMVGKAILRGP